MTDRLPNRASADTLKFATPFGGMFLHAGRTVDGRIVSLALSHKWKEPDAQVSKLIEAIDGALRELVGT